MSDLSNNKISRRKLLPILGSSLLLPFLGFGISKTSKNTTSNKKDYQIMLRKDGTTVKVKSAYVEKTNPKAKKISNNTLLNWLIKKL